MKEKKHPMAKIDLSMRVSPGQPETAEELLRKYGTYEIQPTADSDNPFPTIAQGLGGEE